MAHCKTDEADESVQSSCMVQVQSSQQHPRFKFVCAEIVCFITGQSPILCVSAVPSLRTDEMAALAFPASSVTLFRAQPSVWNGTSHKEGL